MPNHAAQAQQKQPMKKQIRTKAVELQIGDLVSINPYPEHLDRAAKGQASIGFFGSVEELKAALQALNKR